ncbi:hypothetical protein AB0F43_05760 [Kribbella sp. NPDC023972]|uniref:hypothetical protein n=1 Tax=Kribbella sp. NPDC023972 TaxID=3154795 RepID=UPI00340A1EFC
MAPSAQPQSAEITVNEWVRPGDILWFAVGVAMIPAVVWVLEIVPAGDLVEVGNNSAYPEYVDTHRSPLLIPPILVLAIVSVKFGSQLASPLVARLDQDGIKLFADTRFGLRMKVGAPKAEAPWDAIKRVVLRRRRSKLLKFIPVRTTVLSFERPSGRRYGQSASLSPWSVRKLAAGISRFAPNVELVDERNPGKRRVITL